MEEKKPFWTARLALATSLDLLTVLVLGGYVIATSSIGLTKEEIPLRAGLGFLAFAGGLAYFLVPKWFLGASPWQWILGARQNDDAEASVSRFHSSSAFGRRLTISSDKPGSRRAGLVAGFLSLVAAVLQLSLPIGRTDEAYRAVTLCCLLTVSIVQARQLGKIHISGSDDEVRESPIIGNLAVLYLISLTVTFLVASWFILRLFFAA